MVAVLVAESLRMLKDIGFEEASLTSTALDRDQIEAFHPRWEARYLVHPRDANVSKITRALAAIQKR
jgi:hypothetical protein